MKKAASAATAPSGGSPSPTSTPSPASAAASRGKAAPDPIAKLDEDIKKKTNHVRRMSYEHYDTYINYSPSTPNPKNYGKIFWHWYGVASLTPEQAKHAKGFTDFPGLSFPARKPVLDTTAIYEDVFGRFPVVQSIFEPGPGYFVGALPRGANSWYPTWDQRYYLPPDTLDQVAYGALSSGLSSETGLALSDAIFAIRLDTNDTLSFSFRDSGDGFKVAECSMAAYTGIGGDYHPERVGAARFPNKFLLLYLAFPKGQSRVSALSQFATAPNFDEFVTVLAFIAQAAVDAQARGNGAESDPLAAYRVWKRSKSAALPSTFGAVFQGIAAAGSDFAERYLRNHPSLLSGGQSLQLK